MITRALISFIFVVVTAGAGWTNAPESSLRPVARGASAPAVVMPVQARAPTPVAEVPKRKRRGLLRSLKPKQRSERVGLFASKRKRALERGKVCGDRALQGEAIGRVPGKISGCGVNDAVKLRSVSGVTLSQQAVMDCTTAKSLKKWVDASLKPAVRQRGGGVAGLKVAAHYACRTRNNRAGAKISEHGKGRAIDISAIRLKDGSEISVLRDWGKGRPGKILKAARKGACGPFGTVLGPGSDRYHSDHFHFDTARYRGGPYCK